MGSSGTHRLTDYSGTRKGGDKGGGQGGGSGGGGGGSGSGGADICRQAFSVDLEDVEQCDYFLNHGSTPPVGEKLHIVLKKRLVAETVAKGEVVGNIPISHNYLAACLGSGTNYLGLVTLAIDPPPLAYVSADFQPI